jgi:hypothetical protein
MRHRGRVGNVMCARFVCHRCVGSHVLLTCRRLYFTVAVGGFAKVFFFSRGRREIRTCFSGSGSFALAFFCRCSWRTVLRIRLSRLSELAVSRRRRSLPLAVLVRLVTVGVLSSFIYNRPGQLRSVHSIVCRGKKKPTSRSARRLSLRGTFFAL